MEQILKNALINYLSNHKRRLHELKIEQQYFDEILLGNKNFELRFNDRDYSTGDVLHLVTEKGFYVNKQVKYILAGGKYGLDSNYVILSF